MKLTKETLDQPLPLAEGCSRERIAMYITLSALEGGRDGNYNTNIMPFYFLENLVPDERHWGTVITGRSVISFQLINDKWRSSQTNPCQRIYKQKQWFNSRTPLSIYRALKCFLLSNQQRHPLASCDEKIPLRHFHNLGWESWYMWVKLPLITCKLQNIFP